LCLGQSQATLLSPTSYKSRADAKALGLISSTATSVRFGVDSNSTGLLASGARGRASVRLEAVNYQYNEALFVADIQHMPGNACGIWPAFWSFGNNWPYDGEIDIIEGVNYQTQNLYSLHTGSATCTLTNTGSAQQGSLGATSCAVSEQRGDCILR
jgi:hypothetical protein